MHSPKRSDCTTKTSCLRNMYAGVVGELAIVIDHFQSVRVFKSLYKFSVLYVKAQRTIWWLQSRYHCIRRDEGRVPYNTDTMWTLFKPFPIPLTKGLEKEQFWDNFIRKSWNCLKMKYSLIAETLNVYYVYNIKVDSQCALETAKCYYGLLLA